MLGQPPAKEIYLLEISAELPAKLIPGDFALRLRAHLRLPRRTEHLVHVVVQAARPQAAPLALVEPHPIAVAAAIQRERHAVAHLESRQEILTVRATARH